VVRREFGVAGDIAFRIASLASGCALAWYVSRQCRKPTGWVGRFIAWTMNRSHSGLTAWGLKHIEIDKRAVLLDIGCGGGRTVQRLAAMADLGTVRGIDYSEASLAAARKLNRSGIESGRVQIQCAPVSHLPFPDEMFDLATAVETHYYWPALPEDLREVRRVLKPGGSVLIVAEAYGGRSFDWLYRFSMMLLGGAFLSPDEHREMLVQAGYIEAQVFLEPANGWICARGTKPIGESGLNKNTTTVGRERPGVAPGR